MYRNYDYIKLAFKCQLDEIRQKPFVSQIIYIMTPYT